MKYDGKGLVIRVGDKLRSNEKSETRRDLLTVVEVGRDFVWASAPWSNGKLRIKHHRIYDDGRRRGTGYNIVPLWRPGHVAVQPPVPQPSAAPPLQVMSAHGPG